MSDNCCQNKGSQLTKLKKQQANVLWVVLFINLVMFVVEFGAGIRADSISLTGDFSSGVTPEATVMSAIGVIALLANLICLLLLARHREDNLNMSSVWLCSRNDIIANISVLIAAGLVFLTGSILPDLAVGLLLTFVFAKSSGKVLSQSWRALT